jgi:hypothetical protein
MRLALAFALALLVQAPAALTLRIRVFDGPAEVTAETRINVFKAGERQTPVAEGRGSAIMEVAVPQGIYDVQVFHEREGRVVSIRWAERLIVMPYPDEAGKHLEVINFRTGYGALEVRPREGAVPDVAIFPAGNRQQEAARRLTGDGYALFVVPAGRYDLRVGSGGELVWHPDVEVPLDRTRLWIAPQSGRASDTAARQQAQHDNDERDDQEDVD